MTRLSIESQSLADLGWSSVVDALARRCATEVGADRAAELDFAPSIDEARARIIEISEARRLLAADAALPFGGITAVQGEAGRATKGAVLAPEELVAAADAARGISELARHVARHAEQAPGLAARAEPLAELDHVYQPILDAIEPGPRLADHASDALGPLRRKVVALAAELDGRAQTLLDDPEISRHLQDRFTTQREERYVVPVKASAQGWVKGIVHGTSQSGQTVFVEPQSIVDLNNRLVLAEYAVADEERRILAELSAYVGEEAEAIAEGLSIATELDVVAAAAVLAEDFEASPPALEGGAELRLERARNPQLVLMERPCVPNDLVLAPGRTLLISGPNAGGKTVALKTAGLAVAMAHAGLHVLADGTPSIPWLTAVHAHLGDAQSVDRDLSTFSAQIEEFNRFLRGADDRALVLIDEVAVGTDPEQGAALAQALLEAMADRGASAIVTTHYERLKALPPRDERFANASVGFDVDAMKPTFELHLGMPGSSGAFAVARRLNLSEPIVARAESLVGDASAGVEDLLAEIAGERDAVEAERRAASRERAEAQRERADVEEDRRKLAEERRRLRNSEGADAVAALRRARADIDRVRAELRHAKRQEDVAEAEKRLDRASRRVSAGTAREAAPGNAPDPDSLAAGDEVFVSRFASRGRVVEPPSRGRVTVQIGALRTQVATTELRLDFERPAADRRERKTGSARGSGTGAARAAPVAREPAPPRTPDVTLDLRGMRVHEALGELDRFLDRSLLASRGAVYVLHGHGTGALRRAVRDHLEEHPAVGSRRAAEPEEGGDGVTLAWLDGA